MAQQTYRGNLLSANFPFLSEDFGRTVIVGQYDQNVSKSADPAGQDKTQNAGIPQLYYCHNVAPTHNGMQSVSYSEQIAELAPSETAFIGTIALRDALNRTAYLGYTSDGRFYISKSPFNAWTLANTISAAVGKLITRAYAQGVTYIYIAEVGCYKYDFTIDQLVSVTLAGITASEVLGLTSLAGYLIVWTADALAWSAVADPTDFVPSLSTGAGGGSVEGAAGSIQVCAAANAGFLAYTTGNVVAVTYTGNSQYPFIFRALPSSGGLKQVTHADHDSLAAQQYAYTTSGFQLFDIQRAQPVLPDLTDFIAGSEFEDCDSITGVFTKTKLTAGTSMVKAVRLVSHRYLVISYGITSFTHAILYDIQLKRFGKFKLPHVQIVDMLLGEDADDIPRHSVGFLQASGRIMIVDFDAYTAASDSVALLGKYQFMRSRLLQLDAVEFENIEADDTFTVRDLVSLDGKNTTSHTLVVAATDTLYRRYDCRLTGKNHSLFLTGAFKLNSLILTFNVHGRR